MELTSHALRATHFLNGRRGTAERSAAQALAQARAEHLAMLARPRGSNLSSTWSPVGPMQVISASYGKVTGRVTAIAIDSADTIGNTVYVGTTGGGVWKSTNAAGPEAAVTFAALTDTLPVFNANAGTNALPSLSIGALAAANGVLLAGTGDPNDASDSYYGAGVLRSVDGGATWTLTQGSNDGVAGHHSFFGLSFAGFAFSSADPSLVVAAVTQSAEGTLVNASDPTASIKGLYFSQDAGVTWQMAAITDPGGVVQSPVLTGSSGGGNAATAVVWNALRQRFYAAVQFHGYYESADGATWTRLAHQPGAGLTTLACPPNPGTTGNVQCPIRRGALAVQPVSGDMFALTMDGQNKDGGLYQDACGVAGNQCTGSAPFFATRLNSAPLEVGNGSTVIAQADYNLALAAAPAGGAGGSAGSTPDTVLYVGTTDLFRCSLSSGCRLRNTTNAENGCLNPAGVAPSQHALAVVSAAAAPIVFAGNDGGVYRSLDGIAQAGPVCSLDDATHFQNLNGGLGSLAEVVSFAQDPVDPATLLTGLGALGTAGTGTGTAAWSQLATGEGGTVAIDPANPFLWYLSSSAGVSVARCSKGAACTASDFGDASQATGAIGEAQVANDVAAIHAPWLLDPAATQDLLIGTCRAWRGPAANGALWSASNAISRPFGASAARGCSSTFPVARSLAAGGPASGATAAQNAGSQVLYAGLAGSLDGGQGLGGHLFVTASANVADGTTVWTDAAKSPVTNDLADAGVFNPGGFDVSSVVADQHDATGKTVYATIMGFAGNGTNAPHLYRSVDAGSHWTNISSNLPNAPANSVLVDPNDANTIYVALDTGLYVTTQVTNCISTNCWSIYGTGLPDSPVVALAASTNMATGDGRLGELRAATYGRGIWQIPLLSAIAPAAPSIALNPTAEAFAAQQVGTISSSATITVTNTGTANLVVSSIVTSGDFTATDNCVGVPVAQGANCGVQVQFSPSKAGARTGLLTVYGNVSGGQATATLTGTGTPPAAIVLTPLSLVFGQTVAGAQSNAQNVTISNVGGNAATLQTPVTSGDFSISANTCGATLEPSSGCTVSIVFAPVNSGVKTGTLTVSDDAGVQVASLTGTGTSPATDALAPLQLGFGPQPLSTASSPQQVTLTNAGDVALTLISAQITSGDFTVVNGCGNSLNAHATCTFSVSFVPKSVGLGSGVLTVSDQFRSQSVALSGTGLAPAGVSLSPANALTFAATGVGSTGVTQTVTLTNDGGVALALVSVTSTSGASATSDFFIVTGTNTCGTTVAPLAVCTLQVGFTPSAPGVRRGLLSFVDNAGNSPQTLQLTGTGIDFSLTVSGSASASIASGGTATYALLLAADASVPGNAVFTCSGVPVHSLCTVNPVDPALSGTSLMTITVATGLATARLERPTLELSELLPFAACLLLPLGLLHRRARVKNLLRGFACIALFGALATLGCSVPRTFPGQIAQSGGGTGTPVVTPSGTSTLTIAASSAGLVRSVNLTLIVQ